jgi:hypothetical protein
MDCAPVPKLIDGPGWVYEIKLERLPRRSDQIQ